MAAIMVMSVFFVPASAKSASAEGVEGFTSPDACFESSLEAFCPTAELVARNELYNHLLEVSGFEYIISDGEAKGFILIAAMRYDDAVCFEATEMYMSESPFAKAKGKKVYLDANVYIDCVDGVFRDLMSGAIASEKDLLYLFNHGFRYCGVLDFEDNEQVMSYTYRIVENHYIYAHNYMPFYTESPVPSACVPTATASVLAYFSALFSGSSPIRPEEGTFFHVTVVNGALYAYVLSDGPESRRLIGNLATEMKTTASGGTTVANFKTAFTARFARVNSKVIYFSFMKGTFGNTFDLDSFQHFTRSNGGPTMLFLNKYDIGRTNTFIYEDPNEDTIYSSIYTNKHAMVAYGYKRIEYHRNETVSTWSPVWYNPFRFVSSVQDVAYKVIDYLHVSTGVLNYDRPGFLLINKNTIIADAMGLVVQ